MAVVTHDRPEALEPGSAERRVDGEEEIAAPVTLACDRAVGLGVDGQQDAARAFRLCDPPHDDERVPVWIRVHRAGANRVGREAGGVEVGTLVRGGRARAPRVDRPADRLSQEALDGGHLVAGPARWWLEVRVPRHAARRAEAFAAAALGVAERQADLPREVRAQEERQVGAVGFEPQAVPGVLVDAEGAVQEVARRVAQDIAETVPARLRVERIVEEPLHPGRVEVLGVAVPGPSDGPYDAPLRCAELPLVRYPDVPAGRDLGATPEGGAVGARAGCRDLGEPPVRRRAAGCGD